jgi:uptake hydrogenase large subunit
MTRVVVGPFNRVEGDLEVTLDLHEGRVQAARVSSPLYRGFEHMLRGRVPLDALVYAPRICGICSVSQSMASALALGSLAGVSMPRNGELATDLVLASENLADHLTHFYLFFMPDFARAAYRDRRWYAAVHERFRAMEGEALRRALPARARFLNLMGYLAGKWPHTLTLQPGGSARAIEPAEKIRLLGLLTEFRHWLEAYLFGDRLEAVAELESGAALDAWRGQGRPAESDLGLFLRVADELDLVSLGRATDRFLSYGTYPVQGSPLFRRGYWHHGQWHPLDLDVIAEDLSHAWLEGPEAPRHPSVGVTEPVAEKEGAYSWCKAPRLAGSVVETGALARQVVHGHPLVLDLVRRGGGNVRSRVIARLLELALVVPAMEDWVRALRPGERFCNEIRLPAEGQGVGLTESARGSLGHWLDVEKGRIRNYQIVSPTTWNFSPRDRDGVPGALEQALVDTAVLEGEASPAIQHVVRSFDPCMVCTVH